MSSNTPQFQNVRAVLFDLGDTLIHGNFTAGETQSIWEEIYAEIINPTDDPHVPTLATIRHNLQIHVQSSMARTWQEKTEQELDLLALFSFALQQAGVTQADDPDFVRRIIEREQGLLYERVVEVGPDVSRVLATLRERSYKLGLVSNFCNVPDIVYLNLDKIGLVAPFDATVLSCEIGWRKPSCRIYNAVSERLSVPHEACLFVGDRLIEDVQGPQSCGMQAVLTHQYRQETLTPDIHPNAVIKELAELLDLLP